MLDETPGKIEIIKKNTVKILSKQDFKFRVEVNKNVALLDVTRNLDNNSYKPYDKPIKPNTHPAFSKNIPKSVNEHLSEISSYADGKAFDHAKPIYRHGVMNSDYTTTHLCT